MNLREIKIIDLNHSVLDNSVVERIETERNAFEEKLKKLKSTEIDRRDKKLAEKEAERDEKMINFGVAIEELTLEAQKEREKIVEEQRRGEYRFKKKSYVHYKDAGRRPPWKFMWCWYSDTDNYGMYRE
jgi:hypothetical protein